MLKNVITADFPFFPPFFCIFLPIFPFFPPTFLNPLKFINAMKRACRSGRLKSSASTYSIKQKPIYKLSGNEEKFQKSCNLSYLSIVLDFFRKNAPKEYNIKSISKILKIKYATVKSTIYRLYQRGKLKRTHRGFYRATVDEELVPSLGNPPIELHGIKIEGKLQKFIDGISYETKRKIEALGFEETTNNRFFNRLYYKGRKITVTIHEKGLIEVWINSSDNPMGYEEFKGLLVYLDGYLEPLMPIGERKVRQIGLNRDYRELRLDGVSSLSRKGICQGRGAYDD